jgi:subtilase family serine protease
MFAFRPSNPFSRCTAKGTAALKAAAIAAFVVATLAPALAQDFVREPESAIVVKRPLLVPGSLVIPASSQINAADKGVRAHTNVRFIVPATSSPLEAPPYSGYGYDTPASLACIYQVVSTSAGCNPNTTTNTPSGGSETIAIVDAYDDPEAYGDLAYFSEQFGIPFNPANFSIVYASGSQPATDPSGGWELEESLDIEYAHAMAPNATLYLVEANSNSNADLFTAVQVASNLVACGQTTACPKTSKGKGEVSMSWGEGEYSGETKWDSYFKEPNVVYVASAGDSAGVIYPSASPFVVSAGGTSNARSLVTGDLIEQIAWSDAGGGVSSYEPIPSYQSGIASIAGKFRATPDISSDANPNTGVWVFDSFPYDGSYYPSSWWIVGGTSVAAPTITGILNAAATNSHKFAASTSAELTTVYAALASKTDYPADFTDITYGACNYYSGTFAATGYDLCTGVGSPKGLAGK